MKKALLTSFALMLGLAGSAQTTYFSQTVGTNTAGTVYNSGFASVKTSSGTFVTVAATNAGGFEVNTFSSTGTLMLTTKLASSVCTIQNVAYASELPDGSILVTGTGNASGDVFYIAKINLLTNEVTITYKVAETFSYTKGPRAVYNNGAIYAAFPQYAKFDLNKFDTDLNPMWSKTCEVDTMTGKNPGNDCGILDDTTIIVVGKCDTTLGWGEYDTTGGLDSMRLFGIAGYTRVYGMARTADGNMLLAGFNQSYSTFSTNPILLKVGAGGNIIWAKIVEATSLIRFVDVEELPNGNIIAFGTSVEAYSDTYFDGAIAFDASGNLTSAVKFGAGQKIYNLYDVKVYADGLLMSGVITDNSTTTTYNALIYTNFSFGTVCDKTPVTLNASNLAHWETTAIAASDVRVNNGILATTASYGLMTMGSSQTPEICSIGTAVEEMETTHASVYPNPVIAGSTVTITMSAAGSYTLNVLNAAGALVHTSTANGNAAAINTQNLTTGLYIVNIYENGVRVSSEKIAVK
ncbi:MAG TPA: T9SS type A sorting domain-containing protein [Flavobacteriales bacterium]|nr:T9SS type A sorting domain-containing protein [Flavobacteriales bacterium]